MSWDIASFEPERAAIKFVCKLEGARWHEQVDVRYAGDHLDGDVLELRLWWRGDGVL